MPRATRASSHGAMRRPTTNRWGERQTNCVDKRPQGCDSILMPSPGMSSGQATCSPLSKETTLVWALRASHGLASDPPVWREVVGKCVLQLSGNTAGVLPNIHGINVRFDMGTRPFASVLSSECVRSRPF